MDSRPDIKRDLKRGSHSPPASSGSWKTLGFCRSRSHMRSVSTRAVAISVDHHRAHSSRDHSLANMVSFHSSADH
jgi:hypothetical protein